MNGKVDDLISRQAAIDALHMHLMYRMGTDSNKKRLDEWINNLPSAQPEQAEMTKEIRKWINSGNRGSADYFIVDKIEEIINKYER